MRLPVWVCLLALLVPFSVSAKEKVTLQLIWDHQFQFAGYYAADWKGFYAKENLEVEIRSAVRPDRSYLQAAKEILAGRADFGVAGANVLIDYAKGEPFLVLATFFQRSSVAFYYREELGRITPSDLVGLRVALSKGGISEAEFQSMLRVEGIDPAWVDTHPHQVGLAHLAEGRVDVVAGYTLATPEVARRLGLAVRSLRPQNHGVDFYGDSLITHRRMVDRDPRLVEGFVRATIKGWEYALDHTDEIARRIAAELPRVVPVEDLVSFNLFQAEEVKKLMLYPFVRAGNVNPHRWQKMYEHLQASGQVAKGLDIGPLVYDPGLESQQRRRTLLIGLAVVLAVAFLVVLGFMAWTKTLRRILSQRTTELRRSEERYALALEGSKDGVWDWDIQTNGDYFSPEWKAMLGFPPEELQPHLDTFFDLLHPEDLERVRIAGDAHLKEKAPYDLEFRLRHKQGHYVWVHAKGQAVWNENREAVRMAGSIRDITERKRVETLKDQFVSTLSHELRTPLTSIQGSLGLLLGVFPDQLSTEVQELVEISQRNAKSLVTLVNDLLDVRKIEAKNWNCTFGQSMSPNCLRTQSL